MTDEGEGDHPCSEDGSCGVGLAGDFEENANAARAVDISNFDAAGERIPGEGSLQLADESTVTPVASSESTSLKIDPNPTTAETSNVDGGTSSSGRAVVIGEDMPGRVKPFADSYGYDTMPKLDPTLSESEKLSLNREWINACMDEGCTIVDLGPSPAYADYPYITSPFYALEQAEIAARNYSGWIPIWGVFD